MKYELLKVERDKHDELWYMFMHKKTGRIVRIHTDEYQRFISKDM